MTFDALVVSSLALDFGLNFILAHCDKVISKIVITVVSAHLLTYLFQYAILAESKSAISLKDISKQTAFDSFFTVCIAKHI